MFAGDIPANRYAALQASIRLSPWVGEIRSLSAARDEQRPFPLPFLVALRLKHIVELEPRGASCMHSVNSGKSPTRSAGKCESSLETCLWRLFFF